MRHEDRILSRKTGGSVAALLVLCLGGCPIGCFDGRKRQIAQCELTAIDLYGRQDARLRGFFIPPCMEEHGYEWRPDDPRCDARLSMARSPDCYAPRHWEARVVDAIEDTIE